MLEELDLGIDTEGSEVIKCMCNLTVMLEELELWIDTEERDVIK